MTGETRVREFLAARGLADDALEGGAEELVRRWEQAARDAELERYPFGIEDWLNELDGRQLIDELEGAVLGALDEALTARLAEADLRARAATGESSECLWGDRMAEGHGWNAVHQWWYWRRPHAVAEDFEGDA